ncbi:GatB/GatE catalytic domain-containing protein [Astrocystis sublimbata]|nr:GatB/GatE catalytic domain-containing protein [Astrocystis sublimbata]
MPHIRPATLSRYLLHGQLAGRGCLRARPRIPAPRNTTSPAPSVRCRHAEAHPSFPTEYSLDLSEAHSPSHVPLRKKLKEEARRQKVEGKPKTKNANNQVVNGWELTVGIEIHAQLNTAKKLFSAADTSFNDDPNTHVAYFDAAIPGSQPIFQKEVLIPALRAALALCCDIQLVSSFDRKHYFHWDQPSGYQITQYYKPFARDGRLVLLKRDGIAPEDGKEVTVGIKQIQLEQDTAKTLAQPGDVHWIDFNRVGMPLIEIITFPQFHHPATAAAFVRKVQTLLHAVDACVSGMETGGLRADVNVSVRPSGRGPNAPLGQRTEIKNLSSFKAVEDAIIAERDRQIAVLEAGGKIEGETRGWSIGSTETRRLRGKEGEVDYRYMPDPDIAPLRIAPKLVTYLEDRLGSTPDDEINKLICGLDMSTKDAMALVSLDGGLRVEYFWTVVGWLRRTSGLDLGNDPFPHRMGVKDLGCLQLAANWILHELGRLTSDRSEMTAEDLGFTPDGTCTCVPAQHLADLLAFLYRGKITAKVAKELLWAIYRGRVPAEYPSVSDAIEKEGLWFNELGEEEYAALADQAVEGQKYVLRQFIDAQFMPQGKLMFLVGRMIKLGKQGSVNPTVAQRVMKERLKDIYLPAWNS